MPLNRKKYPKSSRCRLYLDAKPNFSQHINEKIKKSVKGIIVIKKLNVTLSRSFLSTIMVNTNKYKQYIVY